MTEGIDRILCLASQVQGQAFLRQCAELGIRPTLLTLDPLRDADWPRDVLEELASMPTGLSVEQVLNTVSWMSRGHRYDRVVALDNADLPLAAQLREHMRIPGMGLTTAGYYRDRLAMLTGAREAGFAVPEFTRVLNYDELRSFMQRVPSPWHLEPRCGTRGVVRRSEDPESLWRQLDELGDAQSRHLLMQMLPGEVYRVSAVLCEGRVLFSVVCHMAMTQTGERLQNGAQASFVVPRESRAWMELTALNAGLAPALGMARGVTEAEFLRTGDGRWLFLEITAPVCAPWSVEVVEAASGVNLWREWARLEAAQIRGENYLLPESWDYYAGHLSDLRPQEQEELEVLRDRSIVLRTDDRGLLLRSEKPEPIIRLVDSFLHRRREQDAQPEAELTATPTNG